MCFGNCVPLQKPLLHGQDTEPAEVQQASVQVLLESFGTFWTWVHWRSIHGFIHLQQIFDAEVSVHAVLICRAAEFLTDFCKDWHQVPTMPGFDATQRRKAIIFFLGLQKAERQSLLVLLGASIPSST